MTDLTQWLEGLRDALNAAGETAEAKKLTSALSMKDKIAAYAKDNPLVTDTTLDLGEVTLTKADGSTEQVRVSIKIAPMTAIILGIVVGSTFLASEAPDKGGAGS